MHVLKQISRALSSTFFRVNLLLFAIFTPIVLTFGSPDVIKSSLKNSGIYESALDGAFESFEKPGEEQGGEQEQDEGPASREALQTAIKAAFTPNLIENSANELIDGTYRWLSGVVEEPDIRIDLTEAKKTFTNTLAAEAVKEVKNKPVCTVEQLRNRSDIDTSDPFELPCRPPGFKPAEAETKVRQEIARNDEFLGDPVITTETLASGEGNTIFEQEQLPGTFQTIRMLPVIFGVLALAFGVALYFLHDEKRRALTIIFRVLISTGLALLIGALLTNFLLGRINWGERIDAAVQLRNAAIDIVRGIIVALNIRFITLGVIFEIIGAGGLLYLHKTKLQKIEEQKSKHESENHRKDSHDSQKPNDSASEDSESK